MLANINLLPKRDSRNVANLSICLIVAFITLILAGLFFIQQYSVEKKRVEIEKEVSQLEEQNAALSSKNSPTNGNISQSSIASLQSAVDYSNGVSLDTVPILNELTKQLPERGFFKAYSYNDLGEITLAVQFDTNREAAYYLARLKESAYFTDADLNSITTLSQDETVVNPENPITESVPEREEDDQSMPRSEAQYFLKINPDFVNPSSEDETDDNPSS